MVIGHENHKNTLSLLFENNNKPNDNQKVQPSASAAIVQLSVLLTHS